MGQPQSRDGRVGSLAMGAARLAQRQREAPCDPRVAQELGRLHYWLARLAPEDAEAAASWQRVIANWSMVFEDNQHWSDWVQERGQAYGQWIDAEQSDSARSLALEHLVGLLAERDERGPTAPGTVPLQLAYELEVRAIRALRRAGGLPPGDFGDERLVCGPLMVRQLGLGPLVAETVRDMPEEPQGLEPILELLRALELDGDEPAPDRETRRTLMHCFSQLGPASACIDQGDAGRALALLSEAPCARCGGARPHEHARRMEGLTWPSVCAGDCSEFEERNPAYALLPSRGELLLRHAIELVAEAHMLCAADYLRGRPPDLPGAVEQWECALRTADVVQAGDRVRTALVETAIGRAHTFRQSDRLDDAIALLTTANDTCPDSRLQGALAEALTDRGVRAGNARQLDQAADDLQRALKINPHSPRARRNLAIALRERGMERHGAGDRSAGLRDLRQAVAVLEEGAEDGFDDEWEREVSETRMLLTLVELGRGPEAPENGDGEGPDDEPRGILGGLLSRLTRRTEPPAGSRDVSPRDPVHACLAQTDLKFLVRADGKFIAPFQTKNRGRFLVRIAAVDEMAVVSVPVRWGDADEAEVFWALLRATQMTDIHKLCLHEDGEPSLVAQVPTSFLSPELLERLIREVVAIMNTPDEDLTSPEALQLSAASGAWGALSAHRTGRHMLGEMLHELSGRGEAAQALPKVCRALRIDCVSEDSQGRYALTLQPGDLKVLAVCRGPRASFVAWIGEIRPRRGNLTFYRGMAEINGQMDICRVALDDDDDVMFIYELPGLNEAAMRDMAERLPRYMLRHGLELMVLAGGGGP